MAGFALEEITRALSPELRQVAATEFKRVITDTRLLEPGDLFVALTGERFDGHDFLTMAAQNGAAGAVVERTAQVASIGDTMTVIAVDDTLAAYQRLARLHRRKFNLPVIAVTGSNGKTTTKDIIAAVLGMRLNVLKTAKNFNNEIGLPLTLLQLNAAHAAAVVEMGMRGRGQIAQLAAVAEPDIGVVTNVDSTHIELLGSVDSIAEAKSELVQALKANSLAVLNGDDRRVYAMRGLAKGRVRTFGCQAHCDVRAYDIKSGGNGTTFSCAYDLGEYRYTLPLVGRHNVFNALAAIAVALEFNFEPEQIQAGFDALQITAMRLEVIRRPSWTIINDAYNASPLSMAAAVDTLFDVASGRAVAVLGDMLELGEFTIDLHKKIGELLAKKRVGVLITVGEAAAAIAEAAKLNGLTAVFSYSGHDEAGNKLREIMQAGDTVLLKGSRGMHMERLLDFID